MKLARIERKRTAPQYNLLKTNDLFQLCEQHRSKIIDFEYEYAKFLVKKKNAHDAANWLSSQLDEVKSKCDRMYKDHRVVWLRERMHEKCQLLLIEL